METRIKINKTMRIMTKIKELLAGREKLAKYDELTEWKEKFERDYVLIPQNDNKVVGNNIFTLLPKPLPSHIKEIIVNALDAEIARLDEE